MTLGYDGAAPIAFVAFTVPEDVWAEVRRIPRIRTWLLRVDAATAGGLRTPTGRQLGLAIENECAGISLRRTRDETRVIALDRILLR